MAPRNRSLSSEPEERAGSRDDGSLRELIGGVVAAASERRLAHLTLQEDPFFPRLQAGAAEEAVDFAVAAGQAAADTTRLQWGLDPESVAAALGVPVTRDQRKARAGKMVLFSEYGDRPPSITLHMDSLGEVNRLIHEHGLEELLGVDDVAPVHLAHEIYHHLEAKKLTPGTAPFTIENVRVGPLRVRTKLPSLSEIAADRFAMALLRLKVHPRVLQFVTVHAHNPALAVSQLERLKSLPA